MLLLPQVIPNQISNEQGPQLHETSFRNNVTADCETSDSAAAACLECSGSVILCE